MVERCKLEKPSWLPSMAEASEHAARREGTERKPRRAMVAKRK